MTKVVKEKIKCHICGTEYEGLIVHSWNQQLSGPFPRDKYKISCPKCGVPYRAQINPSIGTAKDILMKMVTSPEEAGEFLFELSLTEENADSWKNLMLEMDYEEWEKHDIEFRKSTGNLSENSRSKFDENSRKREAFAKLKQDGKIQEIIEKVVGVAKERIKKERDTYPVS